MTTSIEQRRKDIIKARNKLAHLQISKIKNIDEYTCEFRKLYYNAFDSNMNMTILANTYYFQEEYEKIRTSNADTLGARI